LVITNTPKKHREEVEQKLDPIDSSTRPHQDKGNSGVIDPDRRFKILLVYNCYQYTRSSSRTPLPPSEEIFYIEEINPTSYIHMRTPTFRIPQNPDWRDKISYEGKMDLVREKRRKPSAC
jgi:hypothetical protein